MIVSVFYHAFLREKLGRESELLAVFGEAPNAGAVVDAFVSAHPEFARLAGSLNVAVNDEIAGRAAAVNEGARVDLLPPYGGG